MLIKSSRSGENSLITVQLHLTRHIPTSSSSNIFSHPQTISKNTTNKTNVTIGQTYKSLYFTSYKYDFEFDPITINLTVCFFNTVTKWPWVWPFDLDSVTLSLTLWPWVWPYDLKFNPMTLSLTPWPRPHDLEFDLMTLSLTYDLDPMTLNLTPWPSVWPYDLVLTPVTLRGLSSSMPFQNSVSLE